MEEGGWGDTTEVGKKKENHQQGVGWIQGDGEQETGTRNAKGPIKRSGVCTKISFRDVVEAVQSSAHPSSSP